MSALTGKGLVTAGGFSPDTVGASAIFDGSTSYLEQTSAFGVSEESVRFIAGGWFLKVGQGARQVLLGTDESGNVEQWEFEAAETLQVRLNNQDFVTNAVFRDIGWYHVVVSVEVGGSPEVAIYVNGVPQTLSAEPTLGSNPSWFNSTNKIMVGAAGGTASNFFNGYIAQPFGIPEVSIQNSDYAITDFGQQLAAGTNGTIWAAKSDGQMVALVDAASKSNSFVLTDGIAAGTDASGNSNNFTPSGSPTASENTPSKVYSVINPLQNSAATVSSGSLSWSIGAADGFNTSSLGMTNGKWVCEYTEAGSNSVQFGVVSSVAANRVDLAPTTVTGGAYFYADNGNKYVNGSASAYGATYTTSDVIRIELDLDTPQVEFFKNGVSQGAISITETNETWFFAGGSNSGSASYSVVFVESNFSGTPTTGFKALNSANLTAPTYQGADWFNALTYTGNSPSTQSLSGVGFSPDLVWVKNRAAADAHGWFDRIRTATEYLSSNNTDAENTDANSLTSFDTDGFSVGSSHFVNGPSENMVAWNWLGDGTSGSTNNDGTITSTVNVAAPGHFSFGTYTGNGSAGATVGHGLPGAPEMVIYKQRTNPAYEWTVYHKAVGGTGRLLLNDGAAATTNIAFFNNTAPDATTLTLGTNGTVNLNTADFVFYAFRSVPGVCKVGSYRGNGSTDGPYVHLGFKPRWVLFKVSSSTNDWIMYDTERDTYNVSGLVLRADTTAAEFDGRSGNSRELDILSDGFKPRTSNAIINANAATYIYLAMADVGGNGILPPIPGR